MEVVEREAREAAPAKASRRARRRRPGPPPLRERLRLSPMRVGLALGALMLGLVAGFGVAQLGGGDDGRTVVATVDQSRSPAGERDLDRSRATDEDGAILRVQGMPATARAARSTRPGSSGTAISCPQPTFEVEPDGSGAVAVPEDLATRRPCSSRARPRGGATAPSEQPILSVPL